MISADGRRVAFLTSATLSAADRDAATDVYVKDLVTGAVTFASIEGIGEDVAHELDMSDDGRFVAFVEHHARGSFQAFVLTWTPARRRSSPSRRVDGPRWRRHDPRRISASGTHVAFSSRASDLVAEDTNGHDDYFVARRDGSELRRSVGSLRRRAEPRPLGDAGRLGRRPGRRVHVGGAGLVAGDTNEDFDVFAHERR